MNRETEKLIQVSVVYSDRKFIQIATASFVSACFVCQLPFTVKNALF